MTKSYRSHCSRLRQAAEGNGLTLKSVAIKADVSYRQMIRYHQGQAPVDAFTGVAIARAIGVHPQSVDPDLPKRMRSQINATEERIARIRRLITQHTKTLQKLEAAQARDVAIFSQFLEES